MSENKDTLAAGVPTDFHSSPCPINGAFMLIFTHAGTVLILGKEGRYLCRNLWINF